MISSLAASPRPGAVAPSDLLTLDDLGPMGLRSMLNLSHRLKANPGVFRNRLAGGRIGLVFDKPSTRTRVSFESAAWLLGMLPITLRPDELQLGRGETVADSRRTKLLWPDGQEIPRHVFPEEDVRLDLLPAGAVTRHEDGLVEIDFQTPDQWLEEDEELVGHAHDPFKRIDARRTSRHIRVSIGGEVVADTRRGVALFETGLPTRWYIPREDVSAELSVNEGHRTTCAYKGHATHHDVGGERAVAWSYEEPLNDALPVRGMVAFYNERADIEIDGEREERPRTQWSVS